MQSQKHLRNVLAELRNTTNSRTQPVFGENELETNRKILLKNYSKLIRVNASTFCTISFSRLRIGTGAVAGSCEHGNERSGPKKKAGNFVN
jgi:hypothetical protein